MKNEVCKVYKVLKVHKDNLLANSPVRQLASSSAHQLVSFLPHNTTLPLKHPASPG
jgi:hypothetical protein